MFDDKIVNGGEITAIGNFKSDNGAFYIFIAPKSDSASGIGIFNVKLSQRKENTDYPFVVGMWNPVVVNSVNVKSEDLTNYRFFWGETL